MTRGFIGIAAADIQPLYFMEGAAAEELLEQGSRPAQVADRRLRGAIPPRPEGPCRQPEWRSALAWPTDFVARNARAADLIITGPQAAAADAAGRINTGDLVLRAGRPVLVVPPGAEFLRLNSVVVAWKDTREARRAVNDALPLLHKAREVIVVELLDEGADKVAAKARVDDVARWLVRREISASSIATKALVGVTDRLTTSRPG